MNNTRTLLCAFVAASSIAAASCNPQDQFDEGLDAVLTTQEQVNGFTQRKEMNSLTIKGEDITDISALSVATVGSLVIEGTSIVELENDSFTTVTKLLEIKNNPELVSISKLGTKFCTGDIRISGNPKLNSIKALLNLKKMSGKIDIVGNESLGEDNASAGREYGFNVLKELISNAIIPVANITLSNNHPGAATDPSTIGQVGAEGGILSYTIKSLDDIAALKGRVVNDLTVEGSQINDDAWAALGAAIDTVRGNVVVDGVVITTTENLFEKVVCKGSITLKNIETYMEGSGSRFFNTNAFKGYTRIYGDLVLQNIPYLIHWGAGTCFSQIARVDGNLIIDNCGMQQLAFASLQEVGGNFEMRNCNQELYTGWLWNLATKLTTVGGSLILESNHHENTLGGFENISHIGGDVLIKDLGSDDEGIGRVTMDGDGVYPGWSLVQNWINRGFVKGTVNCYYNETDPVEFDVPEALPQEITITSQADIDAIVTPEGGKAVASVLNVKGASVNDDVWSKIKDKVGVVLDDLIVEDCTFTMCSNFFADVEVRGNITLRNINPGSGNTAFLNTDNIPAHCPGNLTIEGTKIHGWAGAGLNAITEIDGDLTFKNCSCANNAAFAICEKVGGNVTISGISGFYGSDQGPWNFDFGFKKIGGNLSYTGNPYVNSLKGFEKISGIGGDVYIDGNGGIRYETSGTDYGFDLVAGWINQGFVKGKVECFYADGTPVTFKTADDGGDDTDAVVILGRDAIIELAAKTDRASYEKLILDGNNESISDSEMAQLKQSVAEVTECLTFRNIKGWTMVEMVINDNADWRVTPQKSLKFINCPDLSNCNGLKWMTEVKGDLVIENCPNLVFNWGAGTCLNQISTIAGDFILKGSGTALTGSTCLASLVKVGGNLTIDNCDSSFWDLNGMPLTEIGGNFTYTNNDLVNSFLGFTGLTNIGGNLLVKGNNISDFSQVASWISGGVVKGTVECYDTDGNKVNF